MSAALIDLEGSDGAGKGVVARRLAAALRQRGHDVVVTAEPSKGPAGLLLREILSRRVGFARGGLAALFAADRADHMERVVEPALAVGKVVVRDRGPLSNLVYRAAETSGPLFSCCNWNCDFACDDPAAAGMALDAEVNRYGCKSCGHCYVRLDAAVCNAVDFAGTFDRDQRHADITIVVDTPLHIAEARREARGDGAEVFDEDRMQRRVSVLYRHARLLLPNRHVAIIDGAGTPEAVTDAALAAVLCDLPSL